MELRCGPRRVQGGAGTSNYARRQGGSEMNGAVSKDKRARSKKLSGAEIVTKYISKNNYFNCWNCSDSAEITENE